VAAEWPVAISQDQLDIGMRRRSQAADDVRILLTADIATQGRVDRRGICKSRTRRTRSSRTHSTRRRKLGKIDDKRALYLVALPLATGQCPKLGVIDDSGARGGVRLRCAALGCALKSAI
jgi:hypothetical protein